MLALRLIAEGRLVCEEQPPPPPPGPGEARLRMKAIALNHIDLWGFRGMAFARRTLPITVGVEGVGEVEALGEGVTAPPPGTRVGVYSGLVCGRCGRCREGRENLCEAVAGIMGFHVDGLAAQAVNVPARLLVPVPDGPSWVQAACGPVTFATVQHMLFDNARLEPGESILVHAAGSGVGSTAILMAKRLGCTVFATVGSDDKIDKARAIGADHVINYRRERFEGVVRRLTGKRGVDVVFEHVGPDTWSGSLLSLARGGRLVTCGSTSGMSAETNLFHLFQQQLRIIGSFGASLRNIREGYAQMASGAALPVIDSEIPLAELGAGLERMRARRVFGKIVVTIP
ncbi:MAG: zinc-binding dehydrogenase [Rhodospirillaceae bacterium]|nr:zinc-binding dehydrogenase [Rhodospirillaceae bacterium]